MAGQVRVNGQSPRKPSDLVKPSDHISLLAADKYVSRGGFKLEHALDYFQLDVAGLTALDIGASTGGFTDCLLQGGAVRVHAVDVGHGQLAWKLRQDPRVVPMDKTNARTLTLDSFGAPFSLVDLAVVDCSFISLRKILLPIVALVKPSGRIIALIKPQFEAGRSEADKGRGVIRDRGVHDRVLNEIRAFVESKAGLQWVGVTESPLLGPAGNTEFLALIEKQ
jgi:23S rRNA (cytidine1920-2'-O)/16S rRNA (cytidine1409-2'-O)-methyltransferase